MLYTVAAILAGIAVTALMAYPLTRGVLFTPPETKSSGYLCAAATGLWTMCVLIGCMYNAAIAAAATGVLLLLLGAAASSHPALRNLLPVWRWAMAMRARLTATDPTYVVEHVLLLRPKGADDYAATYHTDDTGSVLDFDCAVAGVTTKSVTQVCTDGLGAMRCAACSVDEVGPGHWRVRFWTVAPPDPLATARTLDRIPGWNGEDICCGRDSDGQVWSLDFTEVSGIVIAGQPGSGKSAAATLIAAPLLTKKFGIVDIVDGKGAGDWQWAVRRARSLTVIADGVDSIATRLEHLADEMLSDMAAHRWSETDPDFWHVGPSPYAPFHLVVIDESQALFDAPDRQLAARCRRAVMTLVTRGRSAGWCVLLMTQKPVATSIPTDIRDNCTVRISFRMATREAAVAALGTIPDDAPSPVNIPAQQSGRAIVTDANGSLHEIRFDYLPIAVAKATLAQLPAWSPWTPARPLTQLPVRLSSVAQNRRMS